MSASSKTPDALDTSRLLGFRHLPVLAGDRQEGMVRVDRALVKCGEVDPQETIDVRGVADGVD